MKGNQQTLNTTGGSHAFSVKKRGWRSRMAVGALLVLLGIAGSLFVYPYQAARAATAPLVLGELPYQKLLSRSLTDRAALLINVANGNAILKTQDLNIASAGPSLAITRYFNDRASGSGQAGTHTTLSVGADVRIVAAADGSATYQGPSGFKVTFPSNGSGGYTTPAAFTDGTLSKVSGGGWKLTYHKSGDVFSFNSSGRQSRHATAAGVAITYAYNADGTLASATDAQGKVMTFSNYTGTNVGKITDPAGRTVQYGYSNGQLTKVTDLAGKVWSFQYYDMRGNLNQIVDPRGYTTTLTYDSDNRLTTARYNDFTADAAEWKYAYSDGATAVTDPLGHKTTYSYDANGRVTDVVDAVGAHHGASWDAHNNQTARTDPSNAATTLTYDSLNNLTKRQNPATATGAAGAATSYAYANSSQPYRPSKSTDAAGNTVAYSYNLNGDIASTTSASAGGTGMGATTNKYQGDTSGGATVNCSAKAGQLCTSTDARGNTTTYSYDANGNVVKVAPPGPVGARSFTYDSLSRVKTMTDGNGSKVTITYDAADRPTALAYAKDGSTISYGYDEQGNMITRSDAAGTTNWTYDGFNRITKLRQSGKTDLTYTYDAAGNLKTEQGPAGTITYSYDKANQIAGINQSLNGANQTFVYTHGRPTTIYMPGNITVTLGYDTAGRQTSIKAVRSGVTLTDYSATYTTANGSDSELMQTETNNLTGVVNKYGYDGLNRLVKVDGTGTGANDYSYTYDNNGNRTQYSKNGTYSALFGYNAANELTTAGSTANGTYDQAGNQTSTGTGLSFGYNTKNQTTSMTPPGGSAQNITYLDLGQTGRVQFGGTSQQNGLLGLYSDTLGGATTYYHHVPGGSNQIVGQTKGTSTYYYLTDLRGSVVKMVDGSGNTQATYAYDPYGQTLASTGSVANPIRYAGGYYDQSTGLYKFGARYYNPTDARWTQLDPSAQNPGYHYAGDNPVNFTDPSGYAAAQCIGAALSFTGSGLAFIGAGITAATTPLTTAAGAAATFGLAGAGLGFAGTGIGLVASC